MMTEIYPDIPRVYTAIAEVTACAVFAFMLKKPKNRKLFVVFAMAFYVWQSIYLVLTKDFPVVYWIPCMLGALVFMYIFMHSMVRISPISSAYFVCRAFILAEFAASAEWQIVCFLSGIRMNV